MAGITWWNFYFKLFPGTIKAPQIIESLQHLMRHLRRPLLVIWDGLPGHRSAAVRDFVAAQGKRLNLEWLEDRLAPATLTMAMLGPILPSLFSLPSSCSHRSAASPGCCGPDPMS